MDFYFLNFVGANNLMKCKRSSILNNLYLHNLNCGNSYKLHFLSDRLANCEKPDWRIQGGWGRDTSPCESDFFLFMKVSGNTPLPPHPPFELPLLAKGAIFLPKLNRERGESLVPPLTIIPLMFTTFYSKIKSNLVLLKKDFHTEVYSYSICIFLCIKWNKKQNNVRTWSRNRPIFRHTQCENTKIQIRKDVLIW